VGVTKPAPIEGASQLFEALRELVAVLDALWLEEMDRTGDYSEMPPPALERARELLAKEGDK
jgi:hypothetical protein